MRTTPSRWVSGTRVSGMYRWKTCCESGSLKPGDTCIKAWNVRIMSPEQISRTSARATCTTTSALRARCRSRLWLSARPPSRRPVLIPTPAYLITGIRPMTMLTKSASPNVNSSTGPSMPISFRRGRPVGFTAIRSRNDPKAKPSPMRGPRKPQPQPLEEHPPRDAPPPRPECRADRQLLAAAFNAHKQQVCYVCARHQKHHGDGTHQYPQNVSHVADHIDRKSTRQNSSHA